MIKLLNAKNDLTLQLLLIAVAALIFIPFLGGVHLFDWDEINFAESAREMIASGDYLTVQIGYHPFWEKPPLFIWMQVLSMKVFGINEFAARFPNAISGIITLLILYKFGKRIFNHRFALLWVTAYVGSVLPFFYFKSGIIDPWFNLFIFTGISYFVFYIENEKSKLLNLLISATALGLAILTKGPVALLIFLSAFGIYLLLKQFKLNIKWYEPVFFAFILTLVGGSWFILQLLSGRVELIQDFVSYQLRLFSTQDAGHGGFFLYHFVVLLIGVFPASLFAIAGHQRVLLPYRMQRNYRTWMIVLLWIVLVLFTIVKTKIVHYSSLAYFPVTFLAALAIQQMFDRELKIQAWLKVSITIVGSLIAFAFLALPFVHLFKHLIIKSNMINDPFAKANLQADVPWSGLELLIGLVLLAGVILFLYFSGKQKYRQAFAWLFISSFLFVYLAIVFITPKIEGYSQRAAIEFFKGASDKDAYVETLGYKSFAHLFYGKVNPKNRHSKVNSDWLLTGDIDKDAYFSVKIQHKDEYLARQPELQLLYEKNGFVFLFRPRTIPAE